MLQRTGDLWGRYVAPAGTPLEKLSLPYNQIGQPTTLLQVNNPICVESGTAAPWFGQPGGGTQYILNSPLQQLIQDGTIIIME